MFGWEIEIAVIGGVMLGFGWKAVGGGCINRGLLLGISAATGGRYGAAAHRWMNGKDDISLRCQCCCMYMDMYV